jgi:hypothetical protein
MTTTPFDAALVATKRAATAEGYTAAAAHLASLWDHLSRSMPRLMTDEGIAANDDIPPADTFACIEAVARLRSARAGHH